MVHFAVVILTHLKAFFYQTMDLDRDSYSSRSRDIDGLSVFKGTFTKCVGGEVIIKQ
jgi:hypothetical protein